MGQVQSHAAAEAEAVEETPSSSSSSLESLIAGILPLFHFMSKNFCLCMRLRIVYVWLLFYDLLFIYLCLSVKGIILFGGLWNFIVEFEVWLVLLLFP